MGFFNKYPYTDFHELNLDWVLNMLKELDKEWDEFKVLNTITIAGVWDISKNYPKYAIVEDGGTGYMALKPVPAGIAINNLDYWLPVGTYSTAISSLNSRMNTAESNITTLQGTVSGHTTAIDTLTNNLHTVNIKSDVLNGKIVLIGDSYLNGVNANTNWGIELGKYLNKVSDTYSYADSGCGFHAIGDNGKNFNALITDAVNDGSFNNADVSLVLIGGGFNDGRVNASIADILTGVTNCSNNIKSNFPNAQAICAFISNVQYPCNNIDFGKFYNTIESYFLSCGIRGMSFLDNIGQCLKGANGDGIGADGVHPTDLGQELIAISLKNALSGGNSIGVQSNTYYASSDNLWALIDDVNAILCFATPKNYTVSLSNVTLDGSNSVLDRDWSVLNLKPFFNPGNVSFMIQCTVVGDGKYYAGRCKMNIQSDGIVKFYPEIIKDDHTGFQEITSLTALYIPNQTIIIPRVIC